MTKYKNYSDRSDEVLLQQLQQGDSHAFEALYDRYHQRMLILFYRLLGNDNEKAQDFLQDLFLKVLSKNRLFRSEAKFSTWLYTIANNMIKNEYRKQQVRRIMTRDNNIDSTIRSESQDLQGPAEWLDDSAFKAAALRHITELDLPQRSAFLLRHQEQLSIRDISVIMNCSDGTTKSRLFYATRKLAEKLKYFNPDYQATLQKQSKEVDSHEK